MTKEKQQIINLFKLDEFSAKNETQNVLWKSIDENQITLCQGPAGTGKSYTSIFKALSLLRDPNNEFNKILIVKPAVEIEEKLGSLPGDMEEKLHPYIFPTLYLMEKIIGPVALAGLMQAKIIDIMAIAYMRGWNVDHTILLFEEAQNSSILQMKTLLTRIGEHSKYIVSGDIHQSDRFKQIELCGLYDAIARLDELPDIGIVKFTPEDINARNPLITEILKRYE